MYRINFYKDTDGKKVTVSTSVITEEEKEARCIIINYIEKHFKNAMMYIGKVAKGEKVLVDETGLTVELEKVDMEATLENLGFTLDESVRNQVIYTLDKSKNKTTSIVFDLSQKTYSVSEYIDGKMKIATINQSLHRAIENKIEELF